MNFNIVGIGVDLEPVASFRKVRLPKAQRFYKRIFSVKEISYCQRFPDPAQHFAARFCAKEAFVKASRSISPLHITDIEISRTSDGAPLIGPRSRRAAVKKFFRQYEAKISMSHTDEMAVAFVLIGRRRS